MSQFPAKFHAELVPPVQTVVFVVNENEYEAGDLERAKEAMNQELKRSTQGVLNQALKTKAEIVDQRYRFYD